MRKALIRTLLTGGLIASLAAASSFAAQTVTKHFYGSKKLAAGQTRTVTVSYPDALEYGNAIYSGNVRIVAIAGSGGAPDLAKVRILSRGSVLGGSSYQVRARNANARGTAPVRVEVTATTVEPLPHD
ncbi:MAG TPA: hypothetical protein VHM72_10175 [Solirubrobacteraceae bacterium]|nr:hypothetical protein [Solirubrobacteraceae bacterium]